MIVFSQGNYSFVNYEQRVDDMTLLFKIKSVVLEECQAPNLSSNHVRILSNGDTYTSGSPYPGGEIYLQSNYVAISYSENEVGFKLIVSKNYEYKNAYKTLFPTRHSSTEMSRYLNETPFKMIFVPGGIIAAHSDAHFNGLKGKYMALDGVDPIAVFESEDQLYPCLPFPVGLKDEHVQALAGALQKKGSNIMYQMGKSTIGLLSSPEIKGHIDGLRKSMKQYRSLSIDWAIAKAFMMPTSDANIYNGIIGSILSPTNAKFYSDSIESAGERLEDRLVAFIVDDIGFDELLKMSFKYEDLASYVRNSCLPQNSVVMLNSDFQGILDLYNTTFLKYKEKISIGALLALKGQMTALKSRLDDYVTQKLGVFITNAVKDNPLFSGPVRSDSKVEFYLPHTDTINSLDLTPTDDGKNAADFSETARNIISEYSQDSIVTKDNLATLMNQRKADLSTAASLPFINLDNCSFNEARACQTVATLIATVLRDKVSSAGFMDISDVNISQQNNEGRWWGASNKEFSITLFHADRVVSISDCYYKDSYLYMKVKLSCNRIDQDADKGRFKGRDDCNEKLKSVINQKLESFGVESYGSWDFVWYNPAVHIVKCGRFGSYAEGRDGLGRHSGIDVYFSARINLGNFTTTIPLMSLNSFTSASTAQEFDPDCNYLSDQEILDYKVKAKAVANLYETAVADLAASCAYDVCKALFDGCKDNYEFEAYGFIGSTYDSIPVKIKELSYFATVDETYVNKLCSLIDGMHDESMRNALSGFKSQIGAIKPIRSDSRVVYINRNRVMNAEPVTDTNALVHYLYGGI